LQCQKSKSTLQLWKINYHKQVTLEQEKLVIQTNLKKDLRFRFLLLNHLHPLHFLFISEKVIHDLKCLLDTISLLGKVLTIRLT
jgi:hypothetical protein